MVDLLLANDEEAVEYVFFHRCDKMFAHVINSLFHSQAKKEELVTDLYLYLRADDWRRLRQFEFRSELNTWLTMVTVRFFKQKASTSQDGMVETDSDLVEEASQTVDGNNILNEISKLELYKAVDSLPNPRERMVMLGLLAGKHPKTMANELGCTVSAVYKTAQKAKAALRVMMKGNEQ